MYRHRPIFGVTPVHERQERRRGPVRRQHGGVLQPEVVSLSTTAPGLSVSPEAPSPARASPLAVGVVVWLASELMFFGGLFAAYFTLRGVNATWPPEGVELDVTRSLIFTVVLLASSLTMHLSVRAADHADRAEALRWLFVTFLLGAAFLVNLGLEWSGNDFSLSDHAYGSIYYLLTGFHGLHLLGGLGLMIVAAVAVSGGESHVPIGPAFTVSAYYWHFVDAVWIGVFLTVFVVQ
jgi:cytochrome c oxidase subunit 3